VCAHARWCVRECGWWGGLSNFTQAEVVLIANCTCNLRRRTAASASKKRKRPAAAEVVADAAADNEMDEKKKKKKTNMMPPDSRSRPTTCPGLTWSQSGTKSGPKQLVTSTWRGSLDRTVTENLWRSGSTRAKLPPRPWVIEFTNPPGPMRMTGKRRFALSPLASGSDLPQPSTTHATSC
jgi:hypothetical protein